MSNSYGSDRSMTRQWQRPTSWSDLTNISMSGVADTFRDKPEAFLLLAAGAALLMRGRGFGSSAQARPTYGTSSTYQGMPRGTGPERGVGLEQSGGGTGSMRERAESMQDRAGSAINDTMDRARGAANDTMGRARDVASDTMDRARGAIGGTVDKARDAMGDTFDSVRGYGSDLTDRMSRSTGEVRRMARERVGSGLDMLTDNPLLLALCGASAGILAASMLPRTDIEDQALRGVRRQVTDFAEQAQGNIAEAFSEATDTLREETQRRGLTGEGLKEVASKVAGSFTETVTGGSHDDKPAQQSGSGTSGSTTSSTGSTSSAGGTSGSGGTGSGTNTPVSTSATASEASRASGAGSSGTISSDTGASLGGSQSSNATGSIGGGSTSTNKSGNQGKSGQTQGKNPNQSGSPVKTS